MDGSRVHDAFYFNREEPATPATCCLNLDDYETNIQVCNFEEETKTEYTYEDGVCTEHVITMTTIYTDEEERQIAGTLPDVTISTPLDSRAQCCAVGAETLDQIFLEACEYIVLPPSDDVDGIEYRDDMCFLDEIEIRSYLDNFSVPIMGATAV